MINFIKSIDFTSIHVPSEDTASSDESKVTEFITCFFTSLSETIIKQSPPKTSPKQLIERNLFWEQDTPTKPCSYHDPASESTSNPSQMSHEALDESLPIPAMESNVTQQAPALCVENLNVDVTEATLRIFFGRVGGVTSVSISHDPVTRNSNGIAHVKFINMEYGMQSFSNPLNISHGHQTSSDACIPIFHFQRHRITHQIQTSLCLALTSPKTQFTSAIHTN